MDGGRDRRTRFDLPLGGEMCSITTHWSLDDDYRVLVGVNRFAEACPDQKPLAEHAGLVPLLEEGCR